jgi:hypothetical protein
MPEVYSATELSQRLQECISLLQQARQLCQQCNTQERQMKAGTAPESLIAATCLSLLSKAANHVSNVEDRLDGLNFTYQYKIAARPRTGITGFEIAASSSLILANRLPSADLPFEVVAPSDKVELQSITNPANRRVKWEIASVGGSGASITGTSTLGENTADDPNLIVVLRERA